MLAFKRRNEGFEWHRYVRTTIKLKRQDRRDRIAKARDAAVDGLQQAGKAGVAAGGGLLAWLLDAILSVLALLWHWLTQIPALLARVLAPIVGAITRGFGWLWGTLDTLASYRLVRLGSLIAVGIGGTWVAARALTVGLEPIDVRAAIGVAAVAAFLLAVPLISAAAPRVAHVAGRVSGRMGLAGSRASRFVGGALAFAVAGLIAWFAWQPVTQGVRHGIGAVASLAGLTGPELKGRAVVAGATSLAVAGTTVRLAGLDVSPADQPCPVGSDRTRRCTTVAQAALADIVRGQQVVCEVVSGSAEPSRAAVCRVGGLDVGAQMVSRGAAFAEQGLFARYGSEDSAARAAKAGIWRGTPERPSDYKARLVEAARKQAPNGCVIKGTVAGSTKRFVQPWDQDYARLRLRTDRGDKWFCSEDEAIAAGFRPAART